jgi:hypothetical protein
VSLEALCRRQPAVGYAEPGEQHLDAAGQAPAVAHDAARTHGQRRDQVQPLLLAELGARHRRARDQGLGQGELGDETQAAQAQHRFLQDGSAFAGGDRRGELAQSQIGGIDHFALRIARQGTQQVEQLAVLRARDRLAAGGIAQHCSEAIVEMHCGSALRDVSCDHVGHYSLTVSCRCVRPCGTCVAKRDNCDRR